MRVMTINNILDLLINLKVAREIQMSIVPKIFPPFPKHKEFDIYAFLNPPKEVVEICMISF